MQIVPYIRVAGISFGSSEADIVASQGMPKRREMNPIGQLELSYEGCTYRLCAVGRLVEITVDSEYFEIEGLRFEGMKGREIAFVELGYAIAKLDEQSFYAEGFCVSPRFGLAFDPHCPPFLTAFAKDELLSWRKA